MRASHFWVLLHLILVVETSFMAGQIVTGPEGLLKGILLLKKQLVLEGELARARKNPFQKKRYLVLGRANYRPGKKRNLALGRTGFRPGKRAIGQEKCY